MNEKQTISVSFITQSSFVVVKIWSVVLCLIITSGKFCVAQEKHASISERYPFLIQYILRHVKCTNPEVVAEAILQEVHVDEDLLKHPDMEFMIQDLGDGTQGYIFYLPGGGGQWAMYRPSVHFIKNDHTMELFFTEESSPTEYLTTYPKINGRYEIGQWWRGMDLETERTPSVWIHRRWFWDGKQYQEAYTETTYERYGDNNQGTVVVKRSRVWRAGEEARYKSAHRTWNYTVQTYDTLSQICERMGLDMAQIIQQNGIKHPDKIYVGQQLTYDSRLEQLD